MAPKHTTKTRKTEKETLEKILKSQSTEEPRITYEDIEKTYVENEKFQRLLLDGSETDFIKCLNPLCSSFTQKEWQANYTIGI